MRNLIQQLAQGRPGHPDTVLVIGAGSGKDLSLLRQLNAHRLVLVEADPRQFEELARHVDAAKGEEALGLAVTSDDAVTTELLVMNNPRYSSLSTPIALTDHFPNLRVVRRSDVAARSFGAVLEELVPATEGEHVLVLDVPGQAHELLKAVTEQQLQRFESVLVSAAVEPLYADDRGVGESIAVLADAGFEVTAEDVESIYPHAAVLMRRNADRVERQNLLRQLERIGEERVQLKVALNELADASSGQRERVDLLTAQQQVLVEERDSLASQLNESKSRLDAASSEAADAHRTIEELKMQNHALIQRRDGFAKQLAEYKTQAEKEAAQQRTRQAELEAQLKNVSAQCEEALGQLAVVTAQAAQYQKLAADRQGMTEKANRLSEERAERIRALEQELADLGRRQTWLDHEVIRAEAQIDLIRDVLLREKAV